MIRILVTTGMMNAAIARASRRTRQREGNALRLNCRPDYEIIGFLGVEVVKKYFNETNVNFEEFDDGYDKANTGDKYDLLVLNASSRVKLRVDVKTSKKYRTICVNERQYEKAQKNVDILIGVYLESDNWAVVTGYCKPINLHRDSDKDFEFDGKTKKMYSCSNDSLSRFKENDIVI